MSPKTPGRRVRGADHRPPVAAPAYHHGDLRGALLRAAESILLERGIEGFTLRECARRAGVSHAAPAHHFGDVRGLLTALATMGFERMADLMQSRRQAAGDADGQSIALARLAAVGQAYIDFALEHPAHFKLMFAQGRLDRDDAALQLAAQRTALSLSEALQEATDASRVPASDLPARMLLAWSAVHGFATLVIEGQCTQAFGLDVGDVGAASAAAGQVLAALGPALAMPSPAIEPRVSSAPTSARRRR